MAVLALLKIVHAAEPQESGQLVERSTRLVQKSRIAQIAGQQTIAVVLLDPALELGVQRVVYEHARAECAPFDVGERYAQSQARGAAAVLHRAVDVDVHDSRDDA